MFKSKVLKRFRKTFESSTAKPPRTKPRPTVRLWLEELGPRILLNGDLLIWNPTDGKGLASNPANWYDNNVRENGVEAAGISNGLGCQVWLNSDSSNDPIIWDQSANVSSITLNGGGGARGGGG